ncbi:MAG: SDR family NAD(P)-dependent oxidoreductase [Bdellovibrionaceae bacterium]|nr:SDR family NAD(P)-dependent oxidoreductase [Bdellovibrio sp.]
MSSNSVNKTAVIIGASRGLGLGLVQEYLKRGWRVIGTERANNPSSSLRNLLTSHSSQLRIEKIDINSTNEISMLKTNLKGESIDLLFVNAGVMDERTQNVGEASTEEFNRLMITNALSPMRVIETLADLVKIKGTIAVMSSGLGSVTANTTGTTELYRASKAALNMFLKSYAARAGAERTLLAMIPGWVKTDMGGPGAQLEVETSVRGMADAIETRNAQAGVFFVNYKNAIMPW